MGTDGQGNGATSTIQRIFELYVDQLQGDADVADELLLVRLRWFGENVANTIQRLGEDHKSALALVQQLSTLMQQLDAQAGAADQAHASLGRARSWALIIPESTIHER